MTPGQRPASADATNRTMSAIQSRSVRRVSSGAPQRRSVRATSARCAAAAFSKSCAQLRVDGELAGDAGFGVLQDDVADVGQFDVARVEHLDAEHLVPAGDRPQRPHPVDRAEEVADDHRHPAATLGPAQRVDGGRAGRRARPSAPAGVVAIGAQHCLFVHAGRDSAGTRTICVAVGDRSRRSGCRRRC